MKIWRTGMGIRRLLSVLRLLDVRSRFCGTGACVARTDRRDNIRVRSAAEVCGLALGLVLGAAAPQGVNAAKLENAENASDLRDLLDRLQRDSPRSVQRDANGEVVCVMFSSTATSEQDLSLLASIGTLEKLVIGGSADHPGCVSEEGLSVLAKAPQLRSLTLQCFGGLPAGVLRSVSQIRQLEELHLAATFPKEASGYTSLTNLAALRSLEISMATNFGVNELRALKGLKQLNKVSLMETGVRDSDAGVLTELKALTNAVITWHGSRSRFERPGALGQDDRRTPSPDPRGPPD